MDPVKFLKTLLLFTLIASCFIEVVDSTSTCPEKCVCREETRDNLGTLFSVLCSNERLDQIPELDFLQTVEQNQRVNLQSNEIHTVTSGAFPAGAKIVSLDLGKNKGLTFESNALLPLATTLRKLSLEAVGLTFDNRLDMLDGLTRLEDLTLSHNNRYVLGAVEHVTRVLFHVQLGRSLKKLTMSFCGISTLASRSLDLLVNLEELNMANNWFTHFPPGISRLNELKILQLSYCRIKKLNDYDLQNLNKLEELDMSSNSLESIGDNSFHGLKNSLKVLKLSWCGLKEIPTRALHNLEELKYLDLAHNSFKRLPFDSFAGLYCLEDLLVSAEGMELEAGSFSGQESCIKNLLLENMGMKSVPTEALQHLEALQSLSLENNRIEHLPQNAFKGVHAKSISLAGNPLLSIANGAFLGLPANVVLNLRRTKIQDIEFLMGYSETAISSVNLDFVEMMCLCSMKSYLNATQNMHIFGSCTRSSTRYAFNSDSLEDVLEAACQEERDNNGSLRWKPSVGLFCIVHILAMIILR